MKIIQVVHWGQREYYNFYPYYDKMFVELNKNDLLQGGTEEEWFVGNNLYVKFKWSWPEMRKKYL